ncbi:MAG: rhomboid family intramembrane serine protease, partial [Leptospiraceae bacterium]|nr:rhomboid family intramembrane serine protease [Leptospiraceae bacterium]
MGESEFEYRPSPTTGKSIFKPIQWILAINILVYFIQIYTKESELGLSYFESFFALRPRLFFSGMYWQVFSYGFLHASGGLFSFFHIFMNMYAFYILGMQIEPHIGRLKLFSLYFLAQLGGGLFIILHSGFVNYLASLSIFEEGMIQNGYYLQDGSFINIDLIPTVGASGAVFGLLAVFGFLYPQKEVFLFFIGMRAKYAVFAAIAIGVILEKFFDVRLSNAGHLGGALVGIVFFKLFVRKEASFLTREDLDELLKVAIEENINSGLEEDGIDKQIRYNMVIDKQVNELSSREEKEKFLEV